MKDFIGAEYLIAKMLIETHEHEISTAALNRLGICVRRRSIDEGIGAVFLTSREEVYSAIYDYSDYFESVYDEEHRFIGIKINENKNVDDLEKKFIKYLPDAIMELLNEAMKEIAA